MMSIIHEQDFKLYFGILKFINNLFHYVCFSLQWDDTTAGQVTEIK